MRIFHCDHCVNTVFFENVVCGKCGHALAFLPGARLIASLDKLAPGPNPDPKAPVLYTSPATPAKGITYRLCENYTKFNVCNWAVRADDPSPLCRSCRLTQIIPDLSLDVNREAWCRLETAKRRAIYSLLSHQLPVRDRKEDPALGLSFLFKGGAGVLTGHDSGVITVNIAEADDVERERRRVSMHEPYRTLLGHFRHEIGHYYWDLLIKGSNRIGAFRDLFGDERPDYASALARHYKEGPKPNWPEQYVSSYASVHPWEDWAETWAHYMHMTDTIETAATCGLSLQPDRKDEPSVQKQPVKPVRERTFDEIIDAWFPLTYVLNNLNRGMGLADAYPFVLPAPAIGKLRFIHQVICQSGTK